MELKNYQEAVLDRLSFYLKILKEKRQNALALAEIKKKSGLPIPWDSEDFNFCGRAWDELNRQKLLPPLLIKTGLTKTGLTEIKAGAAEPPHKSRLSGLRRPVPNICLKVPTGGGKTILGASAVERINTDFFERNSGFVLWVTPSDSIYRQTLKALTDRESLCRQILDRASARKVKILQKTGSFHPSDTENFLCVMLLMLQSAGRQSKETLRIFRDSGKFPRFFPEADDYHGSQKLLEACPNLDIREISGAEDHSAGGLKKTALKHSLGNVLKLVQPLIVIDEGHRAYSEKAKAALMGFNPRFVLELSATPNKKSHESNVLVSVSGGELKKEEMIKLPINIYNLGGGDWKKALARGHEILQGLSKSAARLRAAKGRYIRPIQLILNWEMAKTLNLSVSQNSRQLRKRNNGDLQLSLFEEVYTEEFKFNNLEKKAAWHLDEDAAVKRWHRIIERQDWHLRGWRKNKIYPDFLVCMKPSENGGAHFSVLETKGRHLMGNPDTEYKKKLFDLFTKYSKQSIDAGAIEIQDQKMTFDLILQDEWRENLSGMFPPRGKA